jgi:SAM-dependent methyltransferase
MSNHVSEMILTLNVLKDMGIALDHHSKILDFGCGTGSAVYAYLDEGFENVYGYDIENYLKLKDRKDDSRFFFSEDALLKHRDSFDFIFSNQVFEHVMDYPRTIQQTYDLLKPGGIALHLFPSKWRFLESHIYVPFGGAFSSHAYLGFWAMLGIRNEFQKCKNWREVQEENAAFCKKNINYLSSKELYEEFRRSFEHVQFKEDLLIKHSPGRLHHFSKFLANVPGVGYLMRNFHARMVFVQKTSSLSRSFKAPISNR